VPYAPTDASGLCCIFSGGGVVSLLWLMLGAALGSSATALLARVAVRRGASRVRESERRARSAERLAEIGSMTSGLAHEIKNPLSTLGLNAQLLSEAIGELEIDEQERGRLTRRVGALRAETERLRGILEDFLEYAGEMRLARRETDLNALIEELGDFFHAQAETRGVRVRLQPSAPVLRASIDPDHIKQALLNLMLNAVAAMDDPSVEQRELILRVDQGGGGVARLHVIDTGPGIGEATRERIFHPYFTTKRGGTGLGLATARRIAEAHGGALELHTELGKGSDFVVVVPIEPGDQPRT